MQYAISFLEGIVTFISPCLLPMLPVYVSYFAGGPERERGKMIQNALGFILGFTLVFVAMGALAGTLGSFLTHYRAIVDLVTGLVVIFFGLHFLGVIRVNLFRGRNYRMHGENLGFISALLFGVAFSLGWTPCVGAFLGSALMLASKQGHVLEGTVMLLCYSLGLGIPFFISAMLIDKLKGAFSFIKSHYRGINLVCGLLLVLMGILMAVGVFGKFLTLLS